MKKIESLAHLMIEFYEKLSSWEHSVVRGKGLTLPQMHTLEILGANDDLQMKELAGKMGVTTGTLTVVVDRLESKGLVERNPHERDRRSIRVSLTPEGQKRFLEHHKLHVQLTQEITSVLQAEEVDSFTALMEKVVARF